MRRSPCVNCVKRLRLKCTASTATSVSAWYARWLSVVALSLPPSLPPPPHPLLLSVPLFLLARFFFLTHPVPFVTTLILAGKSV
jgi:hypothetical protein